MILDAKQVRGTLFSHAGVRYKTYEKQKERQSWWKLLRAGNTTGVFVCKCHKEHDAQMFKVAAKQNI